MTRPVPPCAVDLVKQFEGFSSEAYRCPAGKWTIGYGHTRDVEEGDTISEGEAEGVLREDLLDAALIVDEAVTADLNNNQFGALVSFVFNVGPGVKGEKSGFVHLKTGGPSTLLNLVNAGPSKRLYVPGELLRWHKAGGVPLEGLTRRREAEGKLWSTPV